SSCQVVRAARRSTVFPYTTLFRSTSVAAAALTVAVSVIVGVSVMIASFRNTVADWLDTTLGADIYISPPLLTANRATVDVDPAGSEEHTSELQSRENLVCRLLLEK